ncbi:hypothetical protein XBO1_1390002 [Xenorhabdus bovienii str. oregonense]|uniref:Uncharacterized protein n=1 Tax=Xenorhabdus bovienii str. oregonense TaxID=1398202 RepID=A0A077NRR2_XENBV|nr:hypothetical protein XBO1_1390002 [Xenorhabdus bovienii str. oregonense]
MNPNLKQGETLFAEMKINVLTEFKNEKRPERRKWKKGESM